MSPIIPRKSVAATQNWLNELANAVSNPEQLLEMLEIPLSHRPENQDGKTGFSAEKSFAQRVPHSFINRMKKGDINDPLLRQVLPVPQELEQHAGYSADPLEEQGNPQPGLLHKYHNRVLLIVKGGCAVNCRYCFRRHFPYDENRGSKAVWKQSLSYIAQHNQIDEVILSGGDPLMAKDHELEWLIGEIEQIPHIVRLRIHSRLPVVIPSRVTDKLCQLLQTSRLSVIFVSHINHANEVDTALTAALQKLKCSGVHLLNQSVLLKGVNDSVAAQKKLSEALFDAGVQPYYLHLLDKVQGAAHFYVSDDKAKQIIAQLMAQMSGYMIPKLTKEIGGRSSKTPLDLGLE